MSRLLIILFLLALPSVASSQTNNETEPPSVETESEAVDGVVIDDASQTRDAIREAFDRVDELANVEVEFGAGIATLEGTVGKTENRDAAASIAEQIDGVLWVDNDIRVEVAEPVDDDPTVDDAAIQERLERIFANVDELAEVEVTVRSGVVRLSGRVLSVTALDKAEELAAKPDGVMYVDNDIQEERAVSERVAPAFERATEILEQFISTLPLFAVGLFILVIFYLLAGLATSLQFPYRRLDDKPLIQGIVKQGVRLAVMGAGFVLVLELFDLTALVGAVLGTAGIAGVAIGFAFKDIGENYLASLMLSFRQPFQKNDVVEIGDLQGKVVRLTIRETVLMTLDGNHLRIPNSAVFTSIITNYTRNPLRRFDIAVGIGVGEELASTVKLGRETLEQTKGVLLDPKPFGLIEELGDFTVNVRFFAWVNQTEDDYFRVKSEAVRRIKVAFDQAGIDMPEPTTRILQASWNPPPSKDIPLLENERPDIEPNDEERPSEQVDGQIEEDRAKADEADLLADR